MSSTQSLPGEASQCFSLPVGTTVPATSFPAEDFLFDARRFPSEGCWAFCRFSSQEVPAVRVGFQKGGFNIGTSDRDPDPSLLQLHLEIMRGDGAVLWLPTGRFPAGRIEFDLSSRTIVLRNGGRDVLSVKGWPKMEWHFQSEDAEAEVRLETTIEAVTILPDCLLPFSVFAMWESMGSASGTVRWQDRTFEVEGSMFYDHPRVLRRSNAVTPRAQYLYTTMRFDDGSGMFGYHAVDVQDSPIDYYCFGVYIDAEGNGRFLPVARTDNIATDIDGLPSEWRLFWSDGTLGVEADIRVRDLEIIRSWGSPNPPLSRKDFSIIPLVLDGEARVTWDGRQPRFLRGRGLAEYFNAELWKA
jgi:hypothetical protein